VLLSQIPDNIFSSVYPQDSIRPDPALMPPETNSRMIFREETVRVSVALSTRM